MSLRPIDLQTMFVRLSELSREQAAYHDEHVQSKAADRAGSIKKTVEGDEKVEKTEEVPDALPKIDEKNESDTAKSHEKGSGPEASKDEEASTESADEENIFRDPDLGNRIDISG